MKSLKDAHKVAAKMNPSFLASVLIYVRTCCTLLLIWAVVSTSLWLFVECDKVICITRALCLFVLVSFFCWSGTWWFNSLCFFNHEACSCCIGKIWVAFVMFFLTKMKVLCQNNYFSILCKNNKDMCCFTEHEKLFRYLFLFLLLF